MTSLNCFKVKFSWNFKSSQVDDHDDDDDANSETTGSDDGFQGVELEVAAYRTSGTYLTASGEN